MQISPKTVIVTLLVIGLVLIMYRLGTSSINNGTVAQPTHMMDNGTSMPGMRHGQ